ncbi:alpha/beta fold hydrolase [Mesorhizobium sp. L-2-11]|uniref:alpha/beta fold hydrolase n=1 Tax=Mesorhizobium sp. L-2-11 TaxID=2744521 RepID=UPI0019253737|nr:hypothetical protein [Mesorhizobium sp. L-2-11]
MTSSIKQRLRLSGGTELSFITAGDASNPALLLLHGFPSSSRTFQGIIPGLARRLRHRPRLSLADAPWPSPAASGSVRIALGHSVTISP